MISVECPHCESLFQLNADTAGKAVRCPECRDVFVVPAPSERGTTPPVLPEQPYERVESQPSFVPELAEPPPLPSREAVEPPPIPESPPSIPDAQLLPSAPPQPPPALPILPAAPVLKAAPIPTAAPLPPKEVHWSEVARNEPVQDAEPIDVPVRSRSRDDREEPAQFVRRRRRSPWPRILFFGVSGLTLLLAIGGLIGLFVYLSQAEARQLAEAEESYNNGNFGAARSKYEQLITDYPGSSALDRYQFFAALSNTQDQIGSVATRERPQEAVQQFQQFLNEFGDSPFAQPETGFGSDVFQVGGKLCDAIAENAAEHLKKYRDALKRFETLDDELQATETTIALGRGQFPAINRFREKEGASLQSQQQRFDELEQGVIRERSRLAVLAPYRSITDDPTSDQIERFELALKENSLSEDAEAQLMIAVAERRLRELIGPQGRAILAQAVPEEPFPPLLFATAPAGSPTPRREPTPIPETVFAVARGILYAMDAQDGTLLWGVRLAAATADLRVADIPVQVQIGSGAADWVLIPSESGGRPGLTARLARTGEPVWYQRLEAGPAGRPVVVGGRVYLPLKDKLGTVAEFDLISGTRNGELSVRQPLGGGLTVVPGNREGEHFLVVPGDARRTFLFEIGRSDDEGNPLPARLIRVLMTDHPRDSLRGEPLVITSLDENGPRFLILAQLDGGSGMKLRSFPLPPLAEWIAQAMNENQTTPKAVEVTAPGWAWFPPATDGERVILATDSGAFVAYGVAQIGNQDKPLFTVPGPKKPGDQESVTRSQIVYADEDTYWAVLNGQLVRLRTVIDAIAGLRIEPIGTNRTIGEPVHRAQLSRGLDLGIVVTRVGLTGTIQAQAFDLTTGEIRWQRRLGFAPAGPAVVDSQGRAILADEDGSLFLVQRPTAPGKRVLEATLLASPFAEATTPAVLVGSEDGRTAWILAPILEKSGRRLRVRKVVNGELKADASFPLADEISGAAVVMGEAIVVPVRNGYVYRTDGQGNQLTVGPLWRGDGARGEFTCHLAAIGSDELLITDGHAKFSRWRWPSGASAKWERTGGPWQTRDPITLPPVAWKSPSGDRVVATDSQGVLYLYDGSKAGQPVRRWRTANSTVIPGGLLTERLVVLQDQDQHLVVACVAGRHFFAIAGDQAEPIWVSRNVAAGELPLLGWMATESEILVTEATGRIAIVKGKTGEVKLGAALPSGFAASYPASGISKQFAFLPLADGSLIELELPQISPPPPPRK